MVASKDTVVAAVKRWYRQSLIYLCFSGVTGSMMVKEGGEIERSASVESDGLKRSRSGSLSEGSSSSSASASESGSASSSEDEKAKRKREKREKKEKKKLKKRRKKEDKKASRNRDKAKKAKKSSKSEKKSSKKKKKRSRGSESSSDDSPSQRPSALSQLSREEQADLMAFKLSVQGDRSAKGIKPAGLLHQTTEDIAVSMGIPAGLIRTSETSESITQRYANELFGNDGDDNPARRQRLKREFTARRAVERAREILLERQQKAASEVEGGDSRYGGGLANRFQSSGSLSK